MSGSIDTGTVPKFERRGRVYTDGVTIAERLRPLDEERVAVLAESMKTFGLQHPITVWSPSDDEVHLVAGRHRLAAAVKLGWEEIDCTYVYDVDDIDRQILEIVENVHRNELTKEQRDRHLQRYAELLEQRLARQAQTGSVQNGQNSKGGRPKKIASVIAKETGLSRQTVARAIGQISKPHCTTAAPKSPPRPATENKDALILRRQGENAALRAITERTEVAAVEIAVDDTSEEKAESKKSKKSNSRTARWADAVARASEAVQDLIDIQSEYADWQQNLPENQQDGTVAEKLHMVVDIDLQSALDAITEAQDADLPLGFGRD
jgi:ParB family chromosome partitioning protein